MCNLPIFKNLFKKFKIKFMFLFKSYDSAVKADPGCKVFFMQLSFQPIIMLLRVFP